MAEYRRIAVSVLSGSAGHIVVAELVDEQVIEPPLIRELFAELALVLKSVATRNVVLDFARVRLLSSGALNRLIDFRDQIAAEHGKLQLCGLTADVAEIFEITHLDRYFEIAANQNAALMPFGAKSR